MINKITGIFKGFICFKGKKKSLEWYHKEPLWSPCRKIYDV